MLGWLRILGMGSRFRGNDGAYFAGTTELIVRRPHPDVIPAQAGIHAELAKNTQHGLPPSRERRSYRTAPTQRMKFSRENCPVPVDNFGYRR